MSPSPSPVPAPPSADRVEAQPIVSLLAEHSPLITRIRTCFGLDAITFDAEVVPIMQRYAECVHSLPATQTAHFSEPGGLLRLGLEVAFFSLQGTDGHIFAGRATISERRHLEPRWRLATFIAGLCSELHRIVSHVRVTSDARERWPAYRQPLAAWLLERQLTHYRLRWNIPATESRSLGVLVLPFVVPPALLQTLDDNDGPVVPHLLASVGGLPLYQEHNGLDSLVRRALNLVVDRDLHRRGGLPQATARRHLARYLVDGLRCLLVGHPHWTPNAHRSRAWFATDGLYLLWPQACNDVRRLLDAAPVAGMPDDDEGVLQLLLAGQALLPSRSGDAMWQIRPPGSTASLTAVRLASPGLLLAGLTDPPDPLDEPLTAPPAPAPRAPQEPPGTQLTLLPKPALAPTTEPHPPTTRASQLVLAPPMRLDPAVRAALAEAVEAPTASLCAEGLLVPLQAFRRRRIEPADAVRAMDELQMLVRRDNLLIVSEKVAGPPEQACILARRFIRERSGAPAPAGTVDARAPL